MGCDAHVEVTCFLLVDVEEQQTVQLEFFDFGRNIYTIALQESFLFNDIRS